MTIQIETIVAAAVPSLISGVILLFVRRAEKARDEIKTKLDINTTLTASTARDMESLKERVGRQNGRIDKLEYWRDSHMQWVTDWLAHNGKPEQ